MEDSASELECRVCRSGGDENRPLFHPCLCNGSIGLVHQDCLEAWLAHSKKETCELCFTKYQFVPQYAEDTPSVIPLTILLKSMLKIFMFKILPYSLRIVTAFVMWILVVPIGTTVVYCTCMRRKLTFSSVFSWEAIGTAVCYGFVIDAVMALSLLILMSFADFLRLHWIHAAANQAAQQQNRQHQAQQAPAPAPPAEIPAENPNNALVNQQIEREGLRNRRRHHHGFRVGVPRDLPVQQAEQHRAPESHLAQQDNEHTLIPPSESKESGMESPIRIIPHTGSLDLQAAAHIRQLSSESNDRTDVDWNLVIDSKDSYFADSNVMGVTLKLTPTTPDEHTPTSFTAESKADNMDENEIVRDDYALDNALLSESSAASSVVGDDDNGDDDEVEDVIDENDDDQDEPPAVQAADQRPPLQQQQPQAVNNNDDAFDGPDMQFNDDNQVQVALFDILGLEGPFLIIFRNAAWLMAFSSVYLTLLAFFPFVIGNILVRFGRSKFDEFFPNLFEGFAAKRLLNRLEAISAEKNIPLQFIDFLLIAVGYTTIISVIFSLDWLLFHVKSVKRLEGIDAFADPVRQLATIVKVGVLLIMRIFLLPITLGAAILYLIAQQVIDMDLEQWANFLSVNAVGTYGLAWVAGITFMLSMTISVLQLREVLHPDIFGKLIKPQEAHNDLIASLVQESGLVHTKRIMLSFFVYSILLQMIVGMPLVLFNFLSHRLHIFSPHFFRFSLWYKQPELQIPVELLVGHISFLSVLDHRKDIIGHFQHAWLVMMSRHLGLTRFIIPVPIIGRSKSSRRRRERHLQLHNAINNDQEVNENEQIQVGAPLARPPPGWDIRSSSNSSRWAWGTEEPSAVERNVAPRVTPSFWLLRVTALVLLSWMLLTVVGLLIMTVPLGMGRCFCHFLHVPSFLQHDPLNFVIGSMLLNLLYRVGMYVKKSAMLRVCMLIMTKHHNALYYVIEVILLRILTQFAVGLVIHIFSLREAMFETVLHRFTYPLPSPVSVYIFYAFHMWLSGCMILETYTLIILSDVVGLRLQRALGGNNEFGVWFLQSRLALFELLDACHLTRMHHLAAAFTQQRQQQGQDGIEINSEALVTALRKVNHHIIAPMASFSVMLVQPYAIALGVDALLKLSPSIPRDEKFYTHFAVAVGMLFSASYRLIQGWCYEPFKELLSAAYTRIKDEHYLVGRKLQNAAVRYASAAQEENAISGEEVQQQDNNEQQ